jgi:diphthamide biosynthesis protein 3
MAAVYDDIEIEDMDFDEEKQTYFYPCPCGDKFFITVVRGAAGMVFVWLLPMCSLFLGPSARGW